MVAAPGVVGGDVVEGDVFQVANEGSGLGHYVLAAGEDVDGFVFSDEADELGEFGGDGLKMVGPSGGIAWPGEPDAGLRFPFGGPAVAEGGGSLSVRWFGHEGGNRNAEF